jgi:biotin carboxyl carrier protein
MKFIATVDGKEYRVNVQPGAKPGAFTVIVGGQAHEVDLERAGRDWLYSLLLDGRSFEIVRAEGEISVGGRAFAIEVERDVGLQRAHAGEGASGPAQLRAPIPGLVVAVHAGPGDQAHEGQTLIILEAMKMQMELKSPRAGRLAEVRVQAGQEVNQGQVLAVIAD